MIKDGGDPVQLEHMLLAHVPLQLLQALMALYIAQSLNTSHSDERHPMQCSGTSLILSSCLTRST